MAISTQKITHFSKMKVFREIRQIHLQLIAGSKIVSEIFKFQVG